MNEALIYAPSTLAPFPTPAVPGDAASRHRSLPGLRAGFFAAGRSPETWGESIAAVNRVVIQDNGEKLIDPRFIDPALSVAAESETLVRETVARMLAKAQAALPAGYRLHLLEGYRSLETQRSLFRFACEQLRRRHRRILAGALSSAGLTNYAGEWWHWSYGEPGWAVRTGHPLAIYGAVSV